MGALEIIFGIIVVVMAVFLIIAVLLQSGKDTHMSGAITGSADTFFGQSKANTWDRTLSKLTIVVSTIFAIAVILMYALVG
jgi:preprotein translocase subunit SecG